MRGSEPIGSACESSAWVNESLRCLETDTPAILVSIAGVRGSGPREMGARMLVTEQDTVASIGGGTLEHMATRRARRVLREGRPAHALLTLALEPDLQQCCGGVVTLWLQRIGRSHQAWLRALLCDANRSGMRVLTELTDPDCEKWIYTRAGPVPEFIPQAVVHDMQEAVSGMTLLRSGKREFLIEHWVDQRFNIVLFGAGHVGQALVGALASLDCRVHWVDARSGQFPAKLPGNVELETSASSERVIDAAPPGSYFLVMTHSHSLDQDICKLALQRDDAAYVGLIGSLSKRRHFERVLTRAGLKKTQLERLTCPIGLPGISGKSPAVIAASVVAQLLMEIRHRDEPMAIIHGIDPVLADKSSVAGGW